MTSTSIPLLLAAAAGVGIAHSILPDHWVPLAVISRTNRWSLPRTAKVSFLASLGHVGLSLVLGIVLAAAGLALRSAIVAEEAQIVGAVLVLTGLGFLIWALLPRGHAHPHTHDHAHDGTHDHQHHERPGYTHDHRHDHDHGAGALPAEPGGSRRGSWLAEIAVPFGLAASPDLTILPVFVAASAVGVGAAIGTLLTFTLATICTFVALTVAATVGGYQVQWPWLETNGHVVSALVLLVVGVLVLLRV